MPVGTDEGMIRLGHVVVAKPTRDNSGTVQYDHGKALEGRFERTGALAPGLEELFDVVYNLLED